MELKKKKSFKNVKKEKRKKEELVLTIKLSCLSKELIKPQEKKRKEKKKIRTITIVFV